MNSGHSSADRNKEDQSRPGPRLFGPNAPSRSHSLPTPPIFSPSRQHPEPPFVERARQTHILSSVKDDRFLDFDFQLFGKLSLEEPAPSRGSQQSAFQGHRSDACFDPHHRRLLLPVAESRKEDSSSAGNSAFEGYALPSGILDSAVWEADDKAPYWLSPSLDSYNGSDSDTSSPRVDEARPWLSPPMQVAEPLEPGHAFAQSQGIFIPARETQYSQSIQGPCVLPGQSNAQAWRRPNIVGPPPGILAAASQESRLMSQLQAGEGQRLGRPHTPFVPSQQPGAYARQFETRQAREATSRPIDPTPSPNNRKIELFKTEICRNWEERGTCVYGHRCQFAHGEAELRPVSRDPRWKTKPCKSFVIYGYCPYAKRCCFRHDQGGRASQSFSTSQRRASLLQRVGLIPPSSF